MTELKKVRKLDMGETSKEMLFSLDGSASAFDSEKFIAFPGFCDVHVHFREPGFSYKETIRSGCAAAARGGYTAVCTMPNLSPVPDSGENLKVQTDLIKRDAFIHVLPYGAITVGEKGEELSDLEAMAPDVVAFSDDGRGVQNDDMMRQAMLRTKALGKMIVAHCEVNSLLRGGYIHDGEYARAHGHRGICSESEYAQIERDLKLVRETGCAYHVCHISAKESVELIRRAKAEGLDVSCETAPHYLLLDDSMLQEEGRFKMNPPIRDKADREALIRGILDGTIDIIATDHAPHSAGEKSRGLEKSAFGIVGMETAFPLLYTKDRYHQPSKAGGAFEHPPPAALPHPPGKRLLPVGPGEQLYHRPGALRLPGPGHTLCRHERSGPLRSDRLSGQGRIYGYRGLK